MRAVLVERYCSVDDVSVKEAPSPTVSEGDVAIRVAAAGLGFVDGLKVQGLYQTKDPLPFIPAMDFSGVVERAGDSVSKVRVGDRVFGLLREARLRRRLLFLPPSFSKSRIT